MGLKSLMLTALLLLFSVTSSYTQRVACIPGGNCKPPYCRCPNDPTPPGGIHPIYTPQIVLVSFEYAMNRYTIQNYTKLLQGLHNPNGCPAIGTYFTQKNYSRTSDLQYLHSMGHEIGVTSASGATPSDWTTSYGEVKKFLAAAGIPSIGSRAPSLTMGGDAQIGAIKYNRLVYDSSCVGPDNLFMLWPYTYDFVKSTPKCNFGVIPTIDHPGIWQFAMPELKYKDTACAAPSGCSPYLKTADDTFRFLYSNYVKHYYGQKTPFQLFVDPQWLTVDYQFQGTRQFLEFVRTTNMRDTWILTHSQALYYVLHPVTSAAAMHYKPWMC